ncbi:hypothetical protein [Streptomyces sp. NPDC058394]|uniref:hypothetical protein n=1 Tax=unclassified Streptomyces TaxID=2593676 RepID=UPI00364EA82D
MDHRGVRVERVDECTADNGATDFDGATDEHCGRLLAPVLAAQFMARLDTFIVNVAAPTIRTELGASGTGLQFVARGLHRRLVRLRTGFGHRAVDRLPAGSGRGCGGEDPKRSWFGAGSSWWLSLQ